MAYNSFGKLGYEVLYLPSIAYYYLWSISGDEFQFQFWSPNLPFPDFFVQYSVGIPEDYLLFLAIFCFIGAVQVHGLMVSLFGKEGPSKNPKLKREVLRKKVAIIAAKRPETIPHTPSKLRFIWDFAQSVERDELSRFALRYILLIPAHLLKTAWLLVLIFMLSHISFGDASFIPGLITLSLLTLFLRTRLWKIFPSEQPTTSKSGLVRAEFQRDKHSATRRKLGESRKNSQISFRYRRDDKDS